jgi:hypothetical protein
VILPIEGIRRSEDTQCCFDPSTSGLVMIDLEFDDAEDARALLAKMGRVWQGPGKDVMQNPVAGIVETIDL